MIANASRGVVGRYQLLKGFYRQVGFDDEGQWMEKRIETIDALGRNSS